MQEGLRVQKNAGRFEGSEEYRKVKGTFSGERPF